MSASKRGMGSPSRSPARPAATLSSLETETLLRVRGEAERHAGALLKESAARRGAQEDAARLRGERDAALAAEARLAAYVKRLEEDRRAAAAVLEDVALARDAALSDSRALRGALRDAEKRAAAAAAAAEAASAEARRGAAVVAAAREVARESAAVAAAAEAERDRARARAQRLQGVLQRQVEHARALGVHLPSAALVAHGGGE